MCFRHIWLGLYVASFCIEIDCSFQLVGSKTVNYGENYQFSIVNQKEDTAKLKLQLYGELSGFIDKMLIDLNFLTNTFTFNLKKHINVEKLTLSATIVDFNYSQTVDIEMVHKKFSILIQTDKFSYKKGEKMRFRVFLADSQLQPYHSDELVFTVKKENGDVVYTHDRIEVGEFKGIYDEEFLIADSSQVDETWRVEVSEVDNDIGVEIIGVERFVITDQPSTHFEVTITSKHATLMREQFLELEVSARFDHGFYVKGQATIQATVKESGKEWKTKTKTVQVSKRKVVRFHIFDDLRLLNISGEEAFVTFKCTFEEADTGLKNEKTHSTKICKDACNAIEIIKIEKRLRPGFDYNFQVNVKSMETGDLLQESPDLVKVKVVACVSASCQCLETEDLNIAEIESVLINGIAIFAVDIPKTASKITITASFLNSTRTVEIATSTTRANEYLKVEMITEKPTIDAVIKLNISSTAELDDFYCVIYQSSNIVLNETGTGLYSKETDWSFKSNFLMTPSVNVFIYYFDGETGDFISDELLIEFYDEADDISSKITLDVIYNKLAPGSNCVLTVNTSSDTVVSLTAVKTTLELKNIVDGQKQRNKKPSHRVSNLYVLSDRTASCLDLGLDSNENVKTSLNTKDKFEGFDERGSWIMDYGSESWLFDVLKSDENGLLLLNKTAPEAIATWSVAAAYFDLEHGFQFSNIQTVTIEPNFFAKVNFPNPIRYGEIIKVHITVFNRLQTMNVTVTLQRSEENEDIAFIEKITGCKFKVSDETMTSKQLEVPTNSAGSVTFNVRPLKLGNVKLFVEANGETTNTTFRVEKVLKVELESLAKYAKKHTAIDLRQTSDAPGKASGNFKFYVPDSAVRSSVEVEGTVVGDLFGPALSDASSFTLNTVGSAKSILLQHMKSMLTLKYLTVINQITTVNKTMISKQLATAVSRIVERKNADGSFSFKGQGLFESVWLTAYAVKSLCQVRNLTTVDEIAINGALNFLKSQQLSSNSKDAYNRTSSGSFIEPGSSGAQHNISLTAFVAISFLEASRNIAAEHKDCVNKALNFINQNVMQMTNNLEIAMSAYACALAKHKTSKDLLNHLKEQVIIEQGKHHWRVGWESEERRSAGDLTIEMEIAAYVVLAYIQSNEESKVYPIMMWMVEQVNRNRENFMVKDSIVTAQALTELARIYFSSVISIDLLVFSTADFPQQQLLANVHIDKSNAMSPLHFDLSSDRRDIRFHANGTGFILFEATLKYTELVPSFEETFTISVQVKPRSDGFSLVVCATKKLDDVKEDERDTNDQIWVDLIMQVELPQGFVYNSDSKEMLDVLNIKKTETHNHLVTLHMEMKAFTKICPVIIARRVELGVEIVQQSMSTVKIQHGQETVAVEYYSVEGSQYCGK